MKRLLWIALFATTAITGCKKNDLPSIPPADVKVTVKYADDYTYIKPVSVKVSLKNTETGQTYDKVTDSSGLLTFTQIPAGLYDISGSIKFSPAEFTALSGVVTTDSITFSAAAAGQTINATAANQVQLALNTGRVGDLVLKQIYYAGSHTTNGASFRDQFFEIYNNSSEVIYADSLYFAILEGNRSATTNATNVFQDNKQYDWQKSYGMPATVKANADYVYARVILRIPGTGKQYPILPGKSIVIAQNALNHKAPYTNTTGTVITPKDPSLTVDLSGADFEAHYTEGFNSDIDNPAVPNLDNIYTYGHNDMILDNPGRDAYAIFRHPNITTLPGYAFPLASGLPPAVDAKIHYQIPNNILIDAVEIEHTTPASRFPKKLQVAQDGGYTFVPSGQYSSQSVIRKTVRTVNGRVVVQDTNNSTNDFDYLDRALPRAFK